VTVFLPLLQLFTSYYSVAGLFQGAHFKIGRFLIDRVAITVAAFSGSEDGQRGHAQWRDALTEKCVHDGI